ncbi:MAG TPA: RNA methyltransferase [Polyangia bacterium]|nr:RNA methyltransferase [Polyangia bacterium]
MSLPPIEVRDAADPRLQDYRHLKERHLNAEGGRFVAESERVVRRLIGSGLTVHSVLLTPARLATLAEALGGPFPVFVAAQPVLDAVAGFHVHRGCLAIGERPASAPLPRGARTLVVAEDLTDVDNLGALARHAAAFGADALVLSPRCADPFYRKAIRVSLGAVFGLPVIRLQAGAWPAELEALRADGVAIVGAVVEPGATPLARFVPPARFALLLGAEGPGLSDAARAACDHRVTIPMSGTLGGFPNPPAMVRGEQSSPAPHAIPMSTGADSLNVATAGAIFLYALTQSARR